MAPAPYWTPSKDDIERSHIEDFRKFVNKKYGKSFKTGDYWSLHAWSVESPETINQFWTALWDWGNVIGDKGEAPLFDASLPMYDTHKMATRARLNWAENMLLSHRFAKDKSRKAVVSVIEPDPRDNQKRSTVRSLTFYQLYVEVAQAASALRKLGVGPGDKVAALTPNNAEAIVMVLATSSLGAVWSSSPPEFGISAILDRFTQLKPKVLLTADKYRAMGQDIDIYPKLEAVVPALKDAGLQHIVLVGQLEWDRRPKAGKTSIEGVAVRPYPDFLDRSAMDIKFWRGPANAPLWVLYSSGTTGKPKAIIHNQLGMTLEPKKAFFHNGIREDGCILQVTTTGWMMWNYMVNHLCTGMTVVAYDGSPFAPTKTSMFDLIDEHDVSTFSTSPRFLQVLLQGGFRPKETHRLRELDAITTAGSPLKPELYDYIKDHIKHVFINNGSGGTDVCAGMIGGCKILPIYPGMIQCPMLGVALECFDENGNRLKDGEEGDFVLTKPLPNMPLGLIGDDSKKSKLRETYFNHFPNKTVWYQADYMSIDPESRGITMLGRSDGVLNPQGVRFGSAELYTIVEEMKDQVDDCIAVGQKLGDGDERVVLFVKPLEGNKLEPQLVKRLQDAIRSKLSKRHVPAKILYCPDIPYTANGKRVEVAVKKVVNGTKPSALNTSGMANPKSLDFFVNHPDLKLPTSQQRPKAKL